MHFIIFIILVIVSSPIFSQDTQQQELKIALKERHGISLNYWQELGLKAGINFGYDYELMNEKGHGIAFTIPQILLFNFPDNAFHLGIWGELSYQYVQPNNGFYTALGMGLGWNISYRTVPVFNLEGNQIRDRGFNQLLAIAEWVTGYDFAIKFPQHPFRMYLSLGWKGLYPNNLNINSNIFIQLGFNFALVKKK